MQHLKSNFFNVIVPVEEESEWLLYNTFSGGMEILGQTDGAFLSSLIEQSMTVTMDEVKSDPFLSYLHQRGYLTDISEPEREVYFSNYREQKSHRYEKNTGDIGLTIGTTITCNMGCPYCFEFEKPNKSLRSEDNINAIVAYLRDMVAKAPVKNWRRCMVGWYGGEPLINAGAIENLTPKLLQFCQENGIEYKASIVTNGLLLNANMWEKLTRNHVNLIQITIDGAEEQHNKKRPLKAAKGENYKKILSNLAIAPEGVEITIRINVDRDVASSFDQLFDDMYDYGIWPQRFRSITFSPSWLRPYEEITSNPVNNYLTIEEFFDANQDFRRRLVDRFNRWGEHNDVPRAKLKWNLPSLQADCSTWVSPYNIVIDPEGYIQKCWETIHDSSNHIHHVSEGFHPEAFQKYTAFDKVELNDICRNCQYMPVCDKLPCAFDALKHGKPDCTSWKTKLKPSLKDQYLMMKHHPELMSAPELSTKENTGHSNR
ncbi:MAG TPA: radical SAM protein [Puia sp.]|jgi:uncharacterized protein|nr:radical SAM protein [Puia sp.]